MRKTLTIALAVAMLAGCDRPQPQKAAPPAVQAPSQTPEQIAAERQKEAAREVESVMTTIKTKHPDTTKVIYAINKVALGKTNMYEVVTPEAVFYTDKDVNYILVGSMFSGEGKTVQNITVRPELQEQLRLAQEKAPADGGPKTSVGGFEFFQSLPLQNGFTYTYGTGANHIVVFEDPDCPYCQDLHKSLETFGPQLNVKVTVFPFVMEQLHPNALKRVQNFFCAADPQKAWKEWMLAASASREKGQKDMDALWASWSPTNAPSSDCAQSVMAETWQIAAKQLGYSATPTVVFENGEVVEGNVDRAALEQMFAEVAAQKQQRVAQTADPSANTPSAEQLQQAQQDAVNALQQ